MSLRRNALTQAPPILRVKKAIARRLRPVPAEPAWKARDDLDNRHVSMLLAWVLRPDSCCVDVGAHRGTVLAQMVALAPKGHHVAVEPLPDHAADLRERFPAVEVHQLALSDHDGRAPFVYVENAPALSGLVEPLWDEPLSTSVIDMEVRTLDGLLDGRRVDLLKIDAEGAEVAILRGAVATLAKWQPVVAFEWGGQRTSDMYGDTAAGLHGLLAEHGYRVFDIDGGGPYDTVGLEAVAAAGALWNFVATASSAGG